MKPCLGSFGLFLAMIVPCGAAAPVDKAYVRSLAAPGKTVLVIEYYDGQGGVRDRRGFASAIGFKAVSPTDFAVNDKITIHLFGIEPCDGEMVNRRESFAGRCKDYAEQGLAELLNDPKVVYCRAFVSEVKAPVQDATCYGYYDYPGALNTVDMLEERLVSVGTHRIAKNSDGSTARPDLDHAEQIARGAAFGMWADPRTKAQ